MWKFTNIHFILDSKDEESDLEDNSEEDETPTSKNPFDLLNEDD